VNPFELLGHALGTLCSWLGYIVGRLFRSRLLAATVVLAVIAAGAWMIRAGVPQIVLLSKSIFGAGTVALADCKFPIPKNGTFGPACDCTTTSASWIYLPDKNGEFFLRGNRNAIGSNMAIDVYGFSPTYPKYLYVQRTSFVDAVTHRVGRSCPENFPQGCIVSLIAADDIVENSCRYER
jgi:hypothetical protein